MNTHQTTKHRNPIPTTDIIIEYQHQGQLGIILIERKNPPLGLALPGGFAEYNISLEDNARKEAREETNLEVILENEEQPLCVHSDPQRDPRGHMISVTYIAKGYGKLQAGDDAKQAYHYTIPKLKQLLGTGVIVFDHEKAIKKYLKHRGHL